MFVDLGTAMGVYIHVLGTAMGVYIKFFPRCGQSGSAGAKHFQNLDFLISFKLLTLSTCFCLTSFDVK